RDWYPVRFQGAHHHTVSCNGRSELEFTGDRAGLVAVYMVASDERESVRRNDLSAVCRTEPSHSRLEHSCHHSWQRELYPQRARNRCATSGKAALRIRTAVRIEA